MRLLGWLLAAALFLSPLIVTGLFVWHSQDEQRIVSLAEEEELDVTMERPALGHDNIEESAYDQE